MHNNINNDKKFLKDKIIIIIININANSSLYKEYTQAN